MSIEKNNNNDNTDYLDKYLKQDLRELGVFVPVKMAKQISFIAKRRRQPISHFLLDALKYYIKHECQTDWDYSKMYIREEEMKKGN